MGRLFEKTKTLWGITFIIFTIVASITCSVSVKATGNSGTGGDGGGTHSVTCDTSKYIRTVLCNSHGYGGGSWHIFSTNNYPTLKHLDDMSKNEINAVKGTRPVYETNSDGLSDGGYDKKLSTKCPKNTYDYYIAYVYDGRYHPSSNTTYTPMYLGPARWGTYLTNSNGKKIYISYNNAGAKTYSEIQTALNNGKNVNGWKIKGSRPRSNTDSKYESKEALKFYQKYQKGAKSIPSNIGYFCLSPDIYASKFEGKTVVSGAASGTAGYTKGTVTKTVEAKNCSPTSGCKVTFTHSMKRTSGSQASSYTVNRSSNLSTGNKAISGGKIDSGNFSASEKEVSRSANLVLYPGMKVCEKMNFKPMANSGSESSSTQICVIATGNAQPPNPDPEQPPNPDGNPLVGNSAFLSIKVKNTDVAAYNRYLDTVYAKPGDNLTYRTVYNPVLQYTYNLIPDQIKINDGSVVANSLGEQIWRIYNKKKGGLGNWNNAFSVNSANFLSASYAKDYTFSGGDTTLRKDTNSHQVDVMEVGRSLNEVARTNLNGTTKSTARQVTFSKNSNNNLGNINMRDLIKTAFAKVPYNFINTTEVLKNTDDSKNYLYAGEKESVGFRVTTSPRSNSVTGGIGEKEYATIVRDAQLKLRIRYEKDGRMETVDTAPITGVTLNGTGSKRGETKEFTRTQGDAISFNIPDLPAGSDLCVRSMVWPANSGAETNISPSGYSKDWAESEEVCFTIAKKPSITIWGGNTHTSGKITTAVSNKTNLAGYNTGDAKYNINPANNPKTFIFGSWTELGLIAGGQVSGLASGASTGVANNTNGTLWPNLTYKGAANKTANYSGNGNNNGNTSSPGGKSNTDSFCARSVLTIANNKCSSGIAGNIGSSSSFTNANNDRENIISRLVVTNEDRDIKHTVTNGFSINDESKKSGNGSLYYYNPGDLSFNGGTINKKTTQMIHAKNLTITGDIYYGGEGSIGNGYKTLNEIPRLVLYAEENVTIACNVERIDALVIAGKKVKTCDSDDINSKANSTQLIINGAIITGRLEANRTYGGATGNNTIIPAEIINFDPSLYLWSTNNSDAQGTTDVDSNLETTYITEVAPRY